MSTSGSIDFNMNAHDVVVFALRKNNVIDLMHAPSAEDMRDGLEALNMMLKGWQMTGPNLFRNTDGSATLVQAQASYTLSPRPYRVIEARYRDANGRDLPMMQLTRQEYLDMPMKSITGIPTQYYVDYQRASAIMYVWPTPVSVTTETIQYTYQRAFEDIDDQNNDVDIPQEWFETVAYNLASRIAETYRMPNAAVDERAAQLLALAKDADREQVVRFAPAFR